MKKNLPKLRFSSGFTLIEIMVVMTVITILATMVLYGLGAAQAAARDARRKQIMTGIQASLEKYYGDCQAYPSAGSGFGGLFADAGAVVCGTSLVRGGYLTAAPVDPKSICVGALAATWMPCSPVTVPVYTYTSTGQSYNLRLVGEAGGTTNFPNPD